MLAVGAGGAEVAMAMAGRPFYMMYPRTWGIRLTGKLQPWVSGKDVILELLRRFTCKAGVGKVMEFFGPGVKNLDMSARATISNMGVDIGGLSSVAMNNAPPTDSTPSRISAIAQWSESRAATLKSIPIRMPAPIPSRIRVVRFIQCPAERIRSAYLDHLEVFLADPALWTHEIFRDVFPGGSWGNAFILVAFGLVVDPAADNTMPFPHSRASSWSVG